MNERRINMDAKQGQKSGSKLKQVASLIQELSYTDMKLLSEMYEYFEADLLSKNESNANTAEILIMTAGDIINNCAKFRHALGTSA